MYGLRDTIIGKETQSWAKGHNDSVKLNFVVQLAKQRKGSMKVEGDFYLTAALVNVKKAVKWLARQGKARQGKAKVCQFAVRYVKQILSVLNKRVE